LGTKAPRHTTLMAVQVIYLQRMPTCLNTQKRKLEKTRKYSENYLKFAFTYKENDGEELAVCVVCSSVLSNKTMKPSKLQRHSKTTHAHLKEKKHLIFPV